LIMRCQHIHMRLNKIS